MIYVKLIREEERKTTCEVLNLYHGKFEGVGIDRIEVSNNPYSGYGGYRVTSEDFERIYNSKERERIAKRKEQQTAEEEKLGQEREEIKKWMEEKAEREKKPYVKALNFIKSLFR